MGILTNIKELSEIHFFGKIVAFICLLGVFYLIMTQPQALGAENIINIVYMVLGGALGVLFGQTKK